MSNNFLDQFLQESMAQLKELRPDRIHAFHFENISACYTIIARLDDTTLRSILGLQKKLQLIDSSHFYYPEPNLHLTLLGNLPFSIDSRQLIEIVDAVLPRYSIQFHLEGMGSSESCASVSAYPHDFSIFTMREELRSSIGKKGDDYSSILQNYEHMGWINVLRYLQTPKQSLLDEMNSYTDTNFGMFTPIIIQLYKTTSKVIEPSESVLIKEWNMNQ